MSIEEANIEINSYVNYDEEMVKIVLIIGPELATNATEENGQFSDTFIVDRGNIWDIICLLLHVMYAWPHVNIARNNCDGQKAMLAFYDHFRGQTM